MFFLRILRSYLLKIYFFFTTYFIFSVYFIFKTNNYLADEFQCTGGGISCIPATWRCDLENDCKDNSDEVNCSNNTCAEYQFSCGPPTFRCIYSSWECDGDKDCPDGRDEKNCTTPTLLPTPVNPFAPTVRCILIYFPFIN